MPPLAAAAPYLMAIAAIISIGSFIYRLAMGGGGKSQSAHAMEQAAAAMRLTGTQYGVPVPLAYGKSRLGSTMIWYGDFAAIPHTHTQVTQGGGGGGGSLGGGGGTYTQSYTDYTYAASFLLALCQGPISAVTTGTVWIDKGKATGYTLYQGTYPQSAWPHLVSNYPDQALGYNGVVLVPLQGFDLGPTPSMPLISFEVEALAYDAALEHAAARDVIEDILTNVNHGVGLAASYLDSTSFDDYETYCEGLGVHVDPVYTAQAPAREIIDKLLSLTNSDCVWSGNKLKLHPLGDETLLDGETVLWEPDLTPKYALTDDDFIVSDADDPPVTVIRRAENDIANRFALSYRNRNNDYNEETIEVEDILSIDTYGLKPGANIDASEITLPEIATKVAHLIKQRHLYVRAQYQFTLPWKYMLLEPVVDMVTLTHAPLGLSAKLVRILEKQEEGDGLWSFVAEEVVTGAGHCPDYPYPESERQDVDTNADPGDVTEPVFFMPPGTLTLYMAASGGEDWGGCEVWASETGETYRKIGVLKGKSRYGTLSAELAAPSENPDVANTLSVDLTVSGGALADATEDDASSLQTLCYVDGEYLAFAYASLTDPYEYDLTYLVRGVYGSEMTSHGIGTDFVRVDEAVFSYPVESNMVGKSFYVKLLSFNVFQAARQNLDDVDPYEVTITPTGVSVVRPVEGLVITNTTGSPEDHLDLTCTSVDVLNADGLVETLADVSVTIDLTTTGANGMDTGSLAADTLYYIWTIMHGLTRAAAGLVSLSNSAPTMPDGYTYKRLVGVCYTDASADLKEFTQTGNEWFYGSMEEISTGTTAQAWTDQDASAYLPPEAGSGWFIILVEADVDNVTMKLRKNGAVGTGGQLNGFVLAGTAGNVVGWCLADASQLVELYTDEDAVGWTLYVGGFKLSL
jgi:hypothetical protein